LVEVRVLEFGYSLENRRHFVKFLINGLTDESTEKIVGIIGQIPEGNLKRFQTWKSENGLEIFELFLKDEYPFNNEIPNPKEIKLVEKNVEGFLDQFKQ